jgi:Tn3 transposase DDE domain
VSAHELGVTAARHFTTGKLNLASADVVNAYLLLDLVKAWGDGTSVAADGTQGDTLIDNLLAESHIRYGGYGGIAYHHIADNYIALFSHFIPCGVWEAVYIIEGLLRQQSDAEPDTIHADTQGQSYPVHALAHLFGFQLLTGSGTGRTSRSTATPRKSATSTSTSCSAPRARTRSTCCRWRCWGRVCRHCERLQRAVVHVALPGEQDRLGASTHRDPTCVPLTTAISSPAAQASSTRRRIRVASAWRSGTAVPSQSNTIASKRRASGAGNGRSALAACSAEVMSSS